MDSRISQQNPYSYSYCSHSLSFTSCKNSRRAGTLEIAPSQDGQLSSKDPGGPGQGPLQQVWGECASPSCAGGVPAPLGRVPQLCCVGLHSGAPRGQKSSSGGPVLPKGTSEDQRWETTHADSPLFNCLFFQHQGACMSRRALSRISKQHGHTTNACCLLAEPPRSRCRALAACGHTQQQGSCMPLSNVPRVGAVSRVTGRYCAL